MSFSVLVTSILNVITENMDYWLSVFISLLKVTNITLKLYFITIIFSIPLGIIFALGKISKNKFLKSIISFYTWVVRGTPLLLQLMFVYYGISLLLYKSLNISFTLTAFQAASITFIFNYAAYFTEIFRAGILSIDKGQYEASKALGMNYRQTMISIILPQTIRRVLPPLSNEAITLVKDTALVSIISMQDILRTAKQISSRDVTLSPYVIAAIFYLLLTWVIVYVFRKLEEKYTME